MKDWRRLARLCLYALELLNGLRRSKKTRLALRCNHGRILVVARSKVLAELTLEELISSWEAETTSQVEGNLLTIGQLHQLVHDEADNALFIHSDRGHRSFAVDEDAATRQGAVGGDEDGVLRDPGACDHGTTGHVKDQEEAPLGHHEAHTVLLTEVQSYSKVPRSFRWHLHLHSHLEGSSCASFHDVHDMKLCRLSAHLAFREGEEA
mmetsp:Transcript_38113/g.68884  ORF Transcript_38113/g.68884 Transcript_38113/m.68884 type:complete len:208 (-) Transcript_38113:775-1398(-)